MTKFETMENNFVLLSEQDLLETEGGIEPVTVCLIIAGVAYGSGLLVGLSGR